MAAAGYIINDNYDIEADRINKPGKALIGREVDTFTAQVLYGVLNLIAIILGFYLAVKVDYFQLGFIFVAIILMLWYYSARYKRMVFWGNLVVATLLGFTLFAVWLFEFFALRARSFDFVEAYPYLKQLQHFVWGFAWFAFITTLAREMVKDVEDIEGDRKVGYNTLPVFAGINSSKWAIAFVLLICITTLGFAQYRLFAMGFIYSFWYLMLVDALMMYTFIVVFSAKEKKDWAYLGNLIKLVMVSGVISMQFVYFDI